MLKKFISYVATAAISLTLIACGSGSDSSGDTLVIQKPTKATTILVFGDSVSQGYGVNIYGNYYQQITPGKTYTDLLRQRIGSERLDEFASITVINASIGAETSSEALQRLPTVMGSTRPTHVILAHGTNDAAANLPLTFISDNLISMAGIVNHFGAKPLLADVTFTAFGSGYANEYTAMVRNAANVTNSAYVDILSGIAGNSAYYLYDGVHFNEASHPIMMSNLWNVLIPLFD